jgi:hypothetical protein
MHSRLHGLLRCIPSSARKPVFPLLNLAMPENAPSKLTVGLFLCRPFGATPALLGTQGQVFLIGAVRALQSERAGNGACATRSLNAAPVLGGLNTAPVLGERLGCCTGWPALQGFPAASQRGAIRRIDAKTLTRFACPKPEASSRNQKTCLGQSV